MDIIKVIVILILIGLLFSHKLRKAAGTILLGLILLFYGKAILGGVIWLGQWLASLAGGGHA